MELTAVNAKLSKKNETLQQKCDETKHKKRYYKN
jgi:hypothetical protein